MSAYQHVYPNESYSGCDMVASISYGYEEAKQDGKVVNKYKTYTLGELQTISYSIHMEKRPVRSIGNVNAKDYVAGQRTIAGSLVFAVFNKHFAKNMIEGTNELFQEGESFLVDELPPFNIIISFANEYGMKSRMIIYGVRLLNEGQVMSVNDVYTENTYQFMATDIEYLNNENKYKSQTHGIYYKVSESNEKAVSDDEDTQRIAKAVSKASTDKNDIEHIKMTVHVTDASEGKNKGRVTISLEEPQSEGYVTIYNNDNAKVATIKMNKSSSYNVSLMAPMSYKAVFTKEKPETWTCNNCSFYISVFKNYTDISLYSPIIYSLADTELEVYSNEPSHTQVAIRRVNGYISYHTLTSRKCHINNLSPSTTYYVSTCNGEDTINSPEVKVKTYTTFDQPFKNFKKMIECNIRLLTYKELTRYYKIIDEAYELALKSKKNTSVTNYITTIKKKYLQQLAKLESGDSGRNEILENVYACSELIYISNKIQNTTTAIINKNSEVAVPTKSYNEFYETVLHFDEKITKAEIFRIYNNVAQSCQNVASSTFKKIDDIERSYRPLGRSGLNHYVQALNGGARSAKLEFYELTPDEKRKLITSNDSKNRLTTLQRNSIITSIKNDYNINDGELISRTFMLKAKEAENVKLLDIHIDQIEEDRIMICTNISNIVTNENLKYYIAISDHDDIVNDGFIFKREFTCKEEFIEIDAVEYGLVKDELYSIWIEDESFNQMSNATTFKMSEERTSNDLRMFEIESEKIINDLKALVSGILPSSSYASFCGDIEYSDDVTKINIIDKAMVSIINTGTSFSTITAALSAIKYYIGFMSYCDKIIQNTSYSKGVYSYESDKDLLTIVIAFKDGELIYDRLQSKEIDLARYNCEYAIVLAISNNMSLKSDIAFINLKTDKMEVL